MYILKTAYSTQWALYTLGLHKDIQINLRKTLLATDYLKCDLLSNISKEVLRMYPLAPFLTRILPKDTHLTNHIVPANVCFMKNYKVLYNCIVT